MKWSRRAVWGWALYDWANSAFATTVMAGFFPIFFKQFWSVGTDVNTSTALLGVGNSAASLIIVLLAPLLGAIADRGGYAKRYLLLGAYLGVLATAALFWVPQGRWELAILFFGLGIIGFAGANVFYDALLPQVADADNLDTVSCFGYALGYLGGGVLFAINVAMVLKPSLFGLADKTAAVRWAFLSVSLWWGLFSLFLWAWVKTGPTAGTVDRSGQYIREGLKRLRQTMQEVRSYPNTWLFLLAYWFYIDGVHTIIRMAVDYGLSLGFADNDLILALLLVQFVGFPAALLFARLAARWGGRCGLYIGIGVYVFTTAWGTTIDHKFEFYLLAVLIGLVQGGIQALSRSYYARLIPPGREAEFYGFYNMLGKFAAILGPVLVGGVGLLARHLLMPEDPSALQLDAVGHTAARWSMGSILILFITGAALLTRVKPTPANSAER
jgi:UMF1 family MFS transporter